MGIPMWKLGVKSKEMAFLTAAGPRFVLAQPIVWLAGNNRKYCHNQVIQVLLASFNAPIAQLEERQFPKLEATGSIPVGCATLSLLLHHDGLCSKKHAS